MTPSILKTMGETGEEAIGSMGDDAPLARALEEARLLYTYFKQLFAQVTNPPIDPIREKLVMSVEVLAGAHRNWLEETPEHARLLRLQSPILTNPEIPADPRAQGRPIRSATITCRFRSAKGPMR